MLTTECLQNISRKQNTVLVLKKGGRNATRSKAEGKRSSLHKNNSAVRLLKVFNTHEGRQWTMELPFNGYRFLCNLGEKLPCGARGVAQW
jgi:hypothetical protein